MEVCEGQGQARTSCDQILPWASPECTYEDLCKVTYLRGSSGILVMPAEHLQKS